ncbi:pyridoxal phosphate-dependent aminotransferase [Limibacillus halophilus]|uniref:Aminotransferase n=1 Tax=Limibacillus halophilus TaxID=1579333 RepID=A0A839SUG0_9PROT|nr:pyridoxal phosphate-dependent aminotransferase [Limibacillus halophilus]MBB3065364.1 aspartate aminotransferase [Limibacillus halophilus]
MNSRSLLAPRMGQLRESPTAVVADLVRAMTAKGEHVINFGEGELDFETPEFIKQAGISAIEGGITRYTAVGGTIEVKKAVQTKFQRDNGLDFSLDQLIVGTGGKQLIFNAILATVSAGDEVIIPAPYWVSYPDIVRLAGGTPVIVPGEDRNGFKISPAALSKAITPATKWLVLNSPNNPTGALYSAQELDALLEVIADNPGILVMSDDIYEHIVYEGAFATPAAVRPDLADRILTVNGVSKAYSMTGWRIGFAGGPSWLISAMQVLQSQSTTNAAAMCQEATRAALVGPQDFMAERLERLRTRRDLVVAALNQTQGLRCDTPPGAFYVYVNCQALLGRKTADGAILESDTDVAKYLADDAKVGVVPGTAFGLSPYLRIAYGLDDRDLVEGCRRIRAACGRLN